MCRTVRFEAGVKELLGDGEKVVLELGPGGGMGALVRQQAGMGREGMKRVLGSLPGQWEKAGEEEHAAGVMGRLWVAGVGVDWEGYYEGEKRRRVVLPGYPFERQRYWVEPTGKGGVEKRGRRQPEVADWFWVEQWKRASAPEAEEGEHRWLLLVDEWETGEKLGFGEAAMVSPGEGYAREGADRFRVRPGRREDYEAVLEELAKEGRLPERIGHLWMVAECAQMEGILERGFYSLLALTQALGERGMESCRIDVVSRGMQEVTGGERVLAAKAAVLGPVKVMAQEYPNLRGRSIDVEEVGQVGRELRGAGREEVVALRGRHRWVQSWEKVRLEEGGATGLKRGGVYLITGGMGGIGLALAEYLAKEWEAKLVLLTRRVRAERMERARGIGAEVIEGDVTDVAAVKRAVERAEERFGGLDGVVHAAGVPGVGMMQWKTAAAAAGVLGPKVYGTLALGEALRGRRLDFLVLFSSLTSATGGGPGQADYCAANAFLDAWARSEGREWGAVSVSWGEWQWEAWGGGLAGFPGEMEAYLRANRKA